MTTDWRTKREKQTRTRTRSVDFRWKQWSQTCRSLVTSHFSWKRWSVTLRRVRALTGKDPVLSRVRNFVNHGWPDSRNLKADETLTPYVHRKNELSVHDGILLWGSRVVIPPQCRAQMLDELHDAHPGIVAMKAKARSYIMVASNRQRSWKTSENVWWMSSASAWASQSAETSMGTPESTVVTCSRRLRGSRGRENVSSSLTRIQSG